MSDDSTYDTFFRTVAGDALILRVYLPPSRKGKLSKRSSASCSSGAPPAMKLHGVIASHARLLDSNMRVTGYAPVSSAEEWTSAVSGGMDLGKAVAEVVRDLQLDPPTVEAVTDDGLRKANLGTGQEEEQSCQSAGMSESLSRTQHIRSLMDHEKLGQSTRQVASKDDSTYETFFQTVAGDALILRVTLPPARKKPDKGANPASPLPPPVVQLFGVRATHARLLDSRMRIVGYRPISSAEEWSAAVASGMDLGRAVSEIVRDLQLDPPAVEKVKDRRLKRVQKDLAQAAAGNSVPELDESTSELGRGMDERTSRVSEAEIDAAPSISSSELLPSGHNSDGHTSRVSEAETEATSTSATSALPPPNADKAWDEWWNNGGENRVLPISGKGNDIQACDSDLPPVETHSLVARMHDPLDNSTSGGESTTSGDVQWQGSPNEQSQYSQASSKNPRSCVDSEATRGTRCNLPRPPCTRYDELTVFQAAPLVWRDPDDNLHSIETLDFERERDVLTKALEEGAESIGAQIHLRFETATTRRLGAFLATRGSRALHFTCHGSPDYLCLEGENGSAQFLGVEDLREFMSAGEGGGLSFVFVSACFSESAGEAFLKAGVKHVVCCKLEQALMDQAAVEFSCGFYRALACDMTLQQAFELGRQAVKLCPKVPDAENEMGKFLLLPEDANHDVKVFFVSPSRQKSLELKRSSSLTSRWDIPNPPDLFLGRSKDVYSVLEKLSDSRLVRLTGGKGIGKTSLAAAVCRYISERESAFSYDEIVWLPLICAPREGSMSWHFHNFIDCESSATATHASDEAMRAILEKLLHTKTLVVVEMKRFVEQNKAEMLSLLLRDLFRGNQHVRVLLVCQEGTNIPLPKYCTEAEVSLDSLGLEATATLFGRLCPHVHQRQCPTVRTPRQLRDLLVPEGKEEATMLLKSSHLSKRCIDIFKIMGGGVPLEVHRISKEMTEVQYRQLIEVGMRKEYEVDCKTREELELKLMLLGQDLKAAVRRRKFGKAKEVRVAMEELIRYQEFLPDLESLNGKAEALRKDLDLAASEGKFDEAEQLCKELNAIEHQIGLEQHAHSVLDMGSSRKVAGNSITDEKWQMSRSSLLSNSCEPQDGVNSYEEMNSNSRIRGMKGLSNCTNGPILCP